jgi:NitT/TauT family transport system permease protein
MDLSKYFDLKPELGKRTKTISFVFGSIVIIAIWSLVVRFHWVPKGILPAPLTIITCLPELHFKDFLIQNVFYSFKLNIYGLVEAVVLAIPIGFIIGLNSYLKAVFEPYLSALRFVPLTATVGLFILAFGIETNMKVQFLSFAIFIYLVPVVVQRVDETSEVLEQAIATLGATRWQIIRYLYLPDVLSRVYNDVVILSAISWTYIVVAEMINLTGGVGALSFLAARQARTDKVYAIVIVIVLVGLLQDKIFRLIDPVLFPAKYATKGNHSGSSKS